MTLYNFLILLFSFLMVAFGQPAWVPFLAPLAGCVGFALFWCFLEKMCPLKRGFWWATFWFAGIQTVQLSWMTSIRYQGLYILVVYACLCLWLGVQFGLLTFFVRGKSPLEWKKVTAAASIWVLMEWGRLQILCGFAFNFSGMALAAYLPSLQLATVGGILGLSFWVVFTNLFLFRALQAGFNKKHLMQWGVVALVPYVFGCIYLYCLEKFEKKDSLLNVALIQTGLLPSQKVPLKNYQRDFVSPYHQWQEIFFRLSQRRPHALDLVVLPEAAVPFGFDLMIYSLDSVRKCLPDGVDLEKMSPPLEKPFATKLNETWYVSNAFWAQLMSNWLHADLIGGFDVYDPIADVSFNAAFHFKPGGSSAQIERYEKRILLPLAEFIPWNFLKRFTKAYGIQDFFTPGQQAKIFSTKQRAGISICYEEIFPSLMRESTLKGAEMFVNLTNDSWYPDSKLPMQHFTHSKVRAVENGISLLRSSNTGITAIVDGKGCTIEALAQDCKDVLLVKFPTAKHKTLFLIWGDAFMLSLAMFFVFWYFSVNKIMAFSNFFYLKNSFSRSK